MCQRYAVICHAMTGTACRRRAARGFLARFFAVFAVLAGLVLAHGVQCAEGMSVMHDARGATMVAGVAMECGAPTATVADACTAADPVGAVTPAGDGSPGLGGVLATCLAFIVAVVAAIAGLRPTEFRHVVRICRATRAAVLRTALPRAPSLAELCLLRT